MFLATLARSASSAERSGVLLSDRRRLRAVVLLLGGSANGRCRSTGRRGPGLRDLSERADRVGAGLRDGGNGRDRLVSDALRRAVVLRKRRNGRRLRRRLFERRDLLGRLRSLRRSVDDLRRNGV